MRAVIPDGAGSIVLTDVPEPQPAPGEVVVTVEAYSVNRGETFLLEAPPPGWRPELGLVADRDRTAEVLDALTTRRVRGNAVLEVIP
jgi:NADPH:quinone reductase-like Zn-dependent oxidoreductase